MVGRFAGIQVDGFPAFTIVNAQGYLVAGHPGHRVFYGRVFGLPRHVVNQRIVFYHALVFSVKGQIFSGCRPKSSFLDAEFAAMYFLSAYDAWLGLERNLSFPFFIQDE